MMLIMIFVLGLGVVVRVILIYYLMEVIAPLLFGMEAATFYLNKKYRSCRIAVMMVGGGCGA